MSSDSTIVPSFRLDGLLKRYPGFQLGPLDLEVEPGTVLAFVGPNGSGKTTTLHCMMDLVRPEAGAVEIAGRSNRGPDPSWKEDVGFVGEVHGFYQGWTVARNLAFLSRFYARWSDARAAELTRRFGLDTRKRVDQLSQGNRRKLALVAALAHDPRVLLFDEPTSGLDPVVRAEVLDVLWELMEDGARSIFYSTHVLSDVSRLADEVVFLRDGQILGRHVKDDLVDRWRRLTFRLSGPLPPSDLVRSQRAAGNDVQIVTADGEAALAWLGEIGAAQVQTTRLSVEEIAVEVLREGHDVATGR